MYISTRMIGDIWSLDVFYFQVRIVLVIEPNSKFFAVLSEAI